MTKTLRLLSLSALLATGVAAGAMAASGGNPSDVGSQSVTGTQLDSQQTNTPATGRAPTATSNQYGQTSPGMVGPTGSTQPDATNPVRSNPSGGGNDNGTGGSAGGTGGSAGR